MANIIDVFNFKNNYQTTNLFNKLNLTPEQLSIFVSIIDEGYDLNETRKRVLEFASMTDYESYIHIKKLLKESNDVASVGLNEVLELNELIEAVSKKMNNDIHEKLSELFIKKANQEIANVFFNYVKNAENGNTENIDVDTIVNGVNVASTLYSLKNDILTVIDSAEKETKPQDIKECFKLPKGFEKINNAKSYTTLNALKENYSKMFEQTNGAFYQQLLYETNLKLNTQRMLKNNSLFEAIDDKRKSSIWLNNIGKITITPISENQWRINHYKHSISPISTDSLKQFLTQLTESAPFVNKNDVKEFKTKLDKQIEDGYRNEVVVNFHLDNKYTTAVITKKDDNSYSMLSSMFGRKDYSAEELFDFYTDGNLDITLERPEPKKEVEDNSELGKAKKAVKDFEQQMEWNDMGDDFYYTNGKRDRDLKYLHQLEARVKELEKTNESAEMAVADNEQEIDDKGLISQVMPKFILDIQDEVNPDQKYNGIKNIRDVEVDESTCAGGIASVAGNIFSPRKRKTSESLKFATEALNKIDEFKMTLNNKSIDYSNLNGITLFVEGKIANVNTKADVLKLFEMIDNNEDISSYLFEGLTKADLDLLKEDGDINLQQPSDNISSPDEQEEGQPDLDTQYKEKKNKLSNMAQTGVSNVSVKVSDNGVEKASDDYEIVGLEDNDDAGKASSAVVKNKLTGEIITLDPHKIDIKESVKVGGIEIYLNDDETRIYDEVKTKGKYFAKDMEEFDRRIADKLITKHLLKKVRNPENGLYYTTCGRKIKGKDFKSTMTEVAPPSKEIEKWISKNKDKFKKEYGNDYKRYLYGKAWNKFNSLNEGFELKSEEPANSFNFTLPCGKEVIANRGKGRYWLVEIQDEDYNYLESFIIDDLGEPIDEKAFNDIVEKLKIDSKVLLQKIQNYM